MAPKPRPVLKVPTKSGAGQNVPKTPSSQSMPPPPAPASKTAVGQPPLPRGLLVPEAGALSVSLRNAAIKTGQAYVFYADTKRIGIHRHAPYPPRALLSSLAKDVEQYDQLCDAIQSHLKRAVVVLKRDIKRKQGQIQAAEDAAKRAAAVVPQPLVPPNSPIPSGNGSPVDISPTDPSLSGKLTAPPARRQSTISLSSLHRPPFPHKLDLPSAIMLNPDELPLQDGLASPVTLAPRSSISHIPPEFTIPGSSQQVDIDLTVPDEGATGVSIDPGIGSSADKPIELDLDMEMEMNLFNASHTTTDVPSPGKIKEEPIDMELLSALQATDSSDGGVDGTKTQEDIMSSFDHALNLVPSTSDSANSHINPFSMLQAQQLDAGAIPSPSAILAGLQNSTEGISSELGDADIMQNTGQDDYDFQQFLEQEAVMNDAQMAELFNIETTDIAAQNGVGPPRPPPNM